MGAEAQNICIRDMVGEKWECLAADRFPYKWKRNGVCVALGIYPPDCVNDLNAMHEAEKGLTKDQWVMYGSELSRLNVFPMVHASSAVRAEAFLKTIGKWDDSK